MGKRQLTADQLKASADYSADTGEFIWKRRFSKAGKLVRRCGMKAGSVDAYGRIVMRIGGRLYFAHQLAWLYVHGAWPNGVIDHINGIRSDNRICNLRDVSQAVNMQNRRVAKTTHKLGVIGVSWHEAGRKWRARVGVNRREVHLGLFDSVEEASAAYITAKRRLHEGCTL